ncbi:hypothetical protein AB0L00_15660 [Actinoallomurus sp. NPDC052308]|uniref:hypothetical protein n=1 Tax=Actinoallomurus sp. NPDC052308 TaxID=3155530 RepID=UPI00341F7B58
MTPFPPSGIEVIIVLSRKSASAGLVAIAATAGALFTTPPASAQSIPAAHVSAVVARASASTPLGDGWWRHHRHFRHFHHFRHHRYWHHRFYRGRFGYRHFGYRHFGYPRYGYSRYGHFYPYGDYGGNFNRNVNIIVH